MEVRFSRAAVHCVRCAQCVFAITFASLDDTLDHLQPELRFLVEGLCDQHRDFREAAQRANRESRARRARESGRPYLITNLGKRTIRSG